MKIKYMGKRPAIKVSGAGLFVKGLVRDVTPDQYKIIRHDPLFIEVDKPKTIKYTKKKKKGGDL